MAWVAISALLWACVDDVEEQGDSPQRTDSSEEQTGEDTASAAAGLETVASRAELPHCDENNPGHLSYIEDEGLLVACLSGQWLSLLQQGDTSLPDVSAQTEVEDPGDNCKHGGVKITIGSSTMYACSASPDEGCRLNPQADGTVSLLCEEAPVGAGGAPSFGLGFNWLGELEEPPRQPSTFDAFYYTRPGVACIWDGEEWTPLLEGTSSESACELNDIALGKVLLVDAKAPPYGDGRSWSTAFRYLQDAFTCLREQGAPGEACGAIEAIWVAEGVYYPDEDENGRVVDNDKWAAFRLVPDIGLYGGFAGVETALKQRNLEGHVTVLSGDIAQDDKPGSVDENGVLLDTAGIVGTNASTIVLALAEEQGETLEPSTILDGVTISAGSYGYADGSGGLYCLGTSTLRCNITVRNTVFSANRTNFGGAFRGTYASPTLVNVSFIKNSASANGGAVYLARGSTSFINVVFASNVAGKMGGALFTANGTTVSLKHATFIGNDAASGASLHLSGGTTTEIENSIVWVDGSETNAHIYDDGGATIDVSSSLVEAGSAGFAALGLLTYGGGSSFSDDGHNLSLDPLFESPDGAVLSGASPAIDVGDNDTIPKDVADVDLDGDTVELLPEDWTGDPRVCSDGSPAGEPLVVDMGADEYCP